MGKVTLSARRGMACSGWSGSGLRLAEDEGRRQVCYKSRAASEDPQRETPRITTSWELPQIGRPGALTFGLNAIRGVYAGWGGCVAFGDMDT